VERIIVLDWRLFQLINGLAGRWPLLDGLMRLVVNEYFIPTTMSLLLLALWFMGEEERRRNQRAVLYAPLSVLVANVLLKLCNLAYFRPRPFDNPHLAVRLLFYRPWDSSFPSNPATVGFAFATAVWLHNRRAGAVFYGLATLLCLARVWCGVHYPSDVLAGALLGGLTAYLLVRKARFLDPPVERAIEWGKKLFLA